MATGHYLSSGNRKYATQSTVTPVTRKEKRALMKLSLKQRLRNWILDSDDIPDMSQDICVQEEKLSSQGMRMQIYKASGGFVVETRSYDTHRDRNLTSMHVITEDQDLGDALGKIVMMEALKG